jgi:glycosyltransferase involved in cell wall biosynthesis
MKNKFRYLKKDQRKKILLLSDDIRMHSGVGNMGKEIVLGTAHHFNWVQIAAAMRHPEQGKAFDLSEQVNKEVGLEDSYVRLIPTSGYGNAKMVRDVVDLEKPDVILIFTDPRYWTWLFEIEREIRKEMPITWLNIWDDYPAPLYNRPYYESVDTLMAISKQTKNINELVLDEKAVDKIIEYVPHGINHNHFYPIKENTEDYSNFLTFKKQIAKEVDYDFILFYNSRNIRRKSTSDTILAYKLFCDLIGKEKAKRCAFILHTHPSDTHGTNLKDVREALCDPEYVNVMFSSDSISTAQLNAFYNMADATILLSSNEGWGLSLTESLMTGTPIIANVTGGMQDQMRFENEKGKWIDFSSDFPSNHRGTYKKCGNWATPVFPSNISLSGSPATPYIYDDRCDPEDAAKAILKVYNMSKEERQKNGQEGFDWVTGNEANMTAEKMSNKVIEILDKTLDNFKPRKTFDFYKIEERPKKYIKHKLTDY